MSKIIKLLKKEDSSLILLNKDLYLKTLLVESDSTAPIMTLVDNNHSFNTLYFNFRASGRCFNITSFFYKNNLTNEIFFSFNVVPFYKKCGLLLQNFNKLLFCLEKRKLKKLNNVLDLIFVKLIPGGFKCSYIGILGFLPKKHFFLFLKLDTQKKLLSKLTKSYFLSFFFFKSYFSNFLSRFSCFLSVVLKITRFYYKKKVFIDRIKKRKKIKRWKLNIVFLSSDYLNYKFLNFNNCVRKMRSKTKIYKKHVKSLSFDKK